MADAPTMRRCFLCTQPFHFGPQVYDGKHVRQWGEHICNSCLASNWDGIVPQTWPHVVPTLEAKGVEVTLNARGWIDIPA